MRRRTELPAAAFGFGVVARERDCYQQMGNRIRSKGTKDGKQRGRRFRERRCPMRTCLRKKRDTGYLFVTFITMISPPPPSLV
jgi:hypothetical protein